MKKYIEKYKANWKKKSLFGKVMDLLFYLLIIAMIIPQSRIEVIGFMNKVKAHIIQPSTNSEDDSYTLSEHDYNWSMVDINGNKFNLSDAKGKVVFINVWATWCPPCVGEMPLIQSFYDKFKNNSDVVFLLISDENIPKIKQFMDKRDFSFPVFSSKTPRADIFRNKSIPVSFLISKEGKLVMKHTGTADWSGKKMEEIVNDLLR